MKTNREETVTLDYPVTLAKGVVDRVTMCRPTMALELEFANKDLANISLEMKLFAKLCDLSYEELQHLDTEDYGKLQKLYVRFRTPDKSEGTDAFDGDPEQTDGLA